MRLARLGCAVDRPDGEIEGIQVNSWDDESGIAIPVEHGQGRVHRHFVQPRRGRIGTLAARNSRVRVASCTSNDAAILASDNPLA